MRSLFLLVALLALDACGRSEAEDAVAAMLPEPESARFQSVTRHGDAVCGEVRAGGGANRYVRFVYLQGAASIAPSTVHAPRDLAAFDATCRMLGGQGNALDKQVCAAAADARRTDEQAAAFEALWRGKCG